MGPALAIGAAFFFSLSHIFVRKGVSTLGVSTGTAIMLVLGTLTVSLLGLFIEGVGALRTASWIGILYFCMAGLVHFIGGWGFMNASAARIGAIKVSAVTSLTPFFAAILALITLNEGLSLPLTAGIILIVLGIYLTTTS